MSGQIKVEFRGGLETLFSNQSALALSLPLESASTEPTAKNGESTVGDLVGHLADMIPRPQQRELFMVEGCVRPGILVLINEADWELEGEESYVLQNGDTILFVSTLHGG